MPALGDTWSVLQETEGEKAASIQCAGTSEVLQINKTLLMHLREHTAALMVFWIHHRADRTSLP